MCSENRIFGHFLLLYRYMETISERLNMEKKRLYFDMDGVIVDFVSALKL